MAASWSWSWPWPWPIQPSSSTSVRPSKGLQEKIAYLGLSVGSRKQGYQRERAMTVSMAKYKYKGTRMREKLLTEMIEKKVMEAKEVCKGDETSGSDECKVAWDQVEEVSQAKAHLLRKLQTQDPLEYFCRDNPQLDECQIYEE
ncbi:calvin cycle protein CP12-3, chloroplastic [Cucurbita moschata]|uniref:Calvin cycle protein CP12-3, chloroplastic n=1 Tax=Cucurbita moschata TaxID=3662 RepID=A0A6J1FK63_CUCMO|nr:calvin cycle protein CP12-3, chloroplastic [Cucurbita moschata]